MSNERIKYVGLCTSSCWRSQCVVYALCQERHEIKVGYDANRTYGVMGVLPILLLLEISDNRFTCRDGDLVLVDCGGEYNGYASDITRTWPVNGKFSEPQKKLYQAVLNVNKACIKLCTESHNMSLHGIHDVSVRLMKQELDKINFPVKTGVCDKNKMM